MRTFKFILPLTAAALFAFEAVAQPAMKPTLPDSPGTVAAPEPEFSTSALDPQATGATPKTVPAHEDPQTKRILGIVPNFRAVNVGAKLPPQSVKEKFITATEDSFDYSAIMLPTVVALESYGTDATPEFGSGGVGFGRYLWHTVLDQTSENYFVEFIVPAITREDTRYYTLGKGGFWKRTGYSLSRVVVSRTDGGKPTFNAGEIVGAGAAAGLSNVYYPRPERTFGNTANKWGTSVGIDAFTFMFKEFWPDINHKLFHGEQ